MQETRTSFFALFILTSFVTPLHGAQKFREGTISNATLPVINHLDGVNSEGELGPKVDYLIATVKGQKGSLNDLAHWQQGEVPHRSEQNVLTKLMQHGESGQLVKIMQAVRPTGECFSAECKFLFGECFKKEFLCHNAAIMNVRNAKQEKNDQLELIKQVVALAQRHNGNTYAMQDFKMEVLSQVAAPIHNALCTYLDDHTNSIGRQQLTRVCDLAKNFGYELDVLTKLLDMRKCAGVNDDTKIEQKVPSKERFNGVTYGRLCHATLTGLFGDSDHCAIEHGAEHNPATMLVSVRTRDGNTIEFLDHINFNTFACKEEGWRTGLQYHAGDGGCRKTAGGLNIYVHHSNKTTYNLPRLLTACKCSKELCQVVDAFNSHVPRGIGYQGKWSDEFLKIQQHLLAHGTVEEKERIKKVAEYLHRIKEQAESDSRWELAQGLAGVALAVPVGVGALITFPISAAVAASVGGVAGIREINKCHYLIF